MLAYLGFLSLFLGLYANENCPNGFHRHGNSCYNVITLNETWMDAQVLCQAVGTHLVSVETPEERLYLNQHIYHRFGTPPPLKYYWIGGINYLDGSWMWAQGARNMDIIDWYPGEPSSRPGENCMMMVQNKESRFSNFECDSKQWFVCEYDLHLRRFDCDSNGINN